MLHSSFKNYDEFKELFVAKNSNGTTRRKNGVLLAFLKSKAMRERFDISQVTTMNQMFNLVDDAIWQDGRSKVLKSLERFYSIRLMDGREYASNIYETDGQEGICIDGDFSAYRYVNKERDNRVYKMKVGKMYRHLMDILDFGRSVPEPVKLWMCEEITRRWEAYAQSKMPTSEVELHVDDNFESIYSDSDCNNVDFRSCMQDDYEEHWRFYEHSVTAKAAYLTEGGEIGDGGYVVARCVLFTEVTREDTGEVIRVAERQYSAEGDEVLQRLLIQKLLDGGHIDAYKKTGAGCGDARAFVDKDGNDMSNVKMHIRCKLCPDDHLAYQDSFKWYDAGSFVAYNYSNINATYDLASTDDYFEGGCYSEYNEEYIPEDEAYFVDTRSDYFWNDQVVYAHVLNRHSGGYYQEYCFEDDCIEIGDDHYYAGRNCEDYSSYGIGVCERCGEYYLAEDGYYSELLGEDFCCEDCMERAERKYKKEYWYYSELTDEYYETEEEKEEAETDYKERYWHYSEYDDAYYEYEGDVAEWLSAFDGADWERQTISYESIQWLIENGEAVRDDETGIYYSKKALDEAIAA